MLVLRQREPGMKAVSDRFDPCVKVLVSLRRSEREVMDAEAQRLGLTRSDLIRKVFARWMAT